MNKYVKLITCEEPTSTTGHTYPIDVLDQIEDMFEANGKRLLTDSNINEVMIDLSQVTHVITDIKRVDKSMYVKVEEINHPHKNSVSKDILSVSPMGTGNIDDDGIISNYKLTKISVIPK